MAERLWNSVPRTYRQRDEELGGPMQALLRIIEEQAGRLDADIEQLWNDFFIETARDWVVPYIGDLVGTTPLFDSSRIAESEALRKAFIDLRGPRLVPEVSLRARADVARTIHFRRRKGTLAMLEELARDVTGWAAHAVEFFELLEWTQCVRNHLRFHSLRTPDLRRLEVLDRLDGAFDEISHTVDVRPPESQSGWYNIRNIGFFLWRLQAYEASRVRARDVLGIPHARHFSPLGNPAPLFSRFRREGDEAGLATPLHVPAEISYAAIFEDLRTHPGPTSTSTDYYGLFEEIVPPAPNPENLPVAPEASFMIFIDGAPVPPRRLICMNLPNGDWRQPVGDFVGVDVRRGRISLNAADQMKTVDVFYHYGFSGNLGGGSYERTPFMVRSELAVSILEVPAVEPTVASALTTWAGSAAANTIIRILDNATYILPGPLNIDLTGGRKLTIESNDMRRPHLELSGALTVIGGGPDASLTLSGLLVEGAIDVTGDLGELRLLHSTLVPGRSLHDDTGGPITQSPSISVTGGGINEKLRVSIAFSIVGPIRVPTTAERLSIFDSIVDGVGVTAISDSAVANGPAAPTWLERVTIFGPVFVISLPMASEVIFDGPVTSTRTQEGCVRFSYVAPQSKTPRRYRCQPDLEIEKEVADANAAGTPQETVIGNAVRKGLVPDFSAKLYGRPEYAQLGLQCPVQIRTGAEDGSEMGAFSFLKQPQREANLRIRLDEYLPFGLEPGIIFVT